MNTSALIVAILCLAGLMAPGLSAKAESMAWTKQECSFQRDGMKIYGELYLPVDEGAHPLVILSHGFGGNHRNLTDFAEAFAGAGCAAYVYDFIGGGMGSRSDGKMTEMSVLTEAADLCAVLDGLKAREDIDAGRIYLFGESQGGFVSTYVAGMRPDEIAGLVALYPAYVIQDDARARTPEINNIPETMTVMGLKIGAIYNRDALSFDIYEVMKNYPGKVLIIHGTADRIVPIAYSERAVETFPNAELIVVEGADHGFYGADREEAIAAARQWIEAPSAQ